MQIVVIKNTPSRLTIKQISAWANKVQKRLRRMPKIKKKAVHFLSRRSELTIVFVDLHTSAKLNYQFRKKNKATDVLSFAPVVQDSLGELVFCHPLLVQQAKRHQISLQDEFIYLLIHGILHLIGYDHEKNDRQAAAMYALQDQLFEEFHGHSHRAIRNKKSVKVSM